MHRAAIRVGVDSGGRDPNQPRLFYDPAGDLAAISDQDFGEHRSCPIKSGVLALRSQKAAKGQTSAKRVRGSLTTCFAPILLKNSIYCLRSQFL
jgi:hypothetical protein